MRPDEDEEAVQQQMLSDGVPFDREGYEEAPWQFVRGEEGKESEKQSWFYRAKTEKAAKGYSMPTHQEIRHSPNTNDGREEE